MINPDKAELIQKLKAGTCSEEEIQQIRKMLPDCEPMEASLIMDLLWEYQQDKHIENTSNSEQIYQTILAGMDGGSSTLNEEKTIKRKPRRRLNLKVWQMAAAVLLLIVAGLWWWFPADPTLTFSTGNGEQMTLLLPDSSRVQLNANSTLTYNKQWNDEDIREVHLSGEAYFSVSSRRQSGQKFAVITSDITIEVLGTIFNVNSREEKTAVFLEEGEIALSIHQQEVPPKLMQPGEMLTYSSEEERILINEEAPSPEFFTSWKDGVLIFESIPLAEVLEKIEEIYGIAFQVRDSVNYQRTLRTGLPMQEIDLLIPILEQSLGLTIHKTDTYYVVE